MVRKGLGRGMAALLPAAEEAKKFFTCPVEEIRPAQNQPRKTFSEEKLEELASSIREKGIIQPLVVRKKDDHYELIAGERRWRAAQKAGLYEVPVVVSDASDDSALEMALIENIQREDLNAVEEGEAYRELMEKFDLSQEELSRRVGKDRSTIANFVRILRLPSRVKSDIVEERLSMGHARTLLALEEDEAILKAREEIVRRGLSVRGAEALVKRLKTAPKLSARKKKTLEMADLEERLKRHFGSRVEIREHGGKGKIEISFSGIDELTRIIDVLSLD